MDDILLPFSYAHGSLYSDKLSNKKWRQPVFSAFELGRVEITKQGTLVESFYYFGFVGYFRVFNDLIHEHFFTFLIYHNLNIIIILMKLVF